VLFVGEDEGFLRQAAMINLVRDHGSIRFEVNSDALDRSQIHFSSKILALAKAGNEPSQRWHKTRRHPRKARRLERSTPPDYPELAGRISFTGTAQVQRWSSPMERSRK